MEGVKNSTVTARLDALLAQDFAAIMSIVCGKAGMMPQEVLSRTRDMRACNARHVVSYLMRQRGHSFSRIGRCLRRNHATVIYGIRTIEDAVRVRHGYGELLTLFDASRKEWTRYVSEVENGDYHGKF